MESELAPRAYMDLAKSTGVLRLFTLGYTAHLARNLFLGVNFMPSEYGSGYQPLNAFFALGAVLLSHPFEVARTLIVHQEGTSLTGNCMSTLRALY